MFWSGWIGLPAPQNYVKQNEDETPKILEKRA
jgi:hypothetical protein